MKFEVVEKQGGASVGQIAVDKESGGVSVLHGTPELYSAGAKMVRGILILTSQQVAQDRWASLDEMANPKSPFFFAQLVGRLRDFGFDIPRSDWPRRTP